MAIYGGNRLRTNFQQLVQSIEIGHESVEDGHKAAFRAWLGADHPGPRVAASATVPVGL